MHLDHFHHFSALKQVHQLMQEGHTNKAMIVHFFDFEGTRLDFVDVFFAQATQD